MMLQEEPIAPEQEADRFTLLCPLCGKEPTIVVCLPSALDFVVLPCIICVLRSPEIRELARQRLTAMRQDRLSPRRRTSLRARSRTRRRLAHATAQRLIMQALRSTTWECEPHI